MLRCNRLLFAASDPSGCRHSSDLWSVAFKVSLCICIAFDASVATFAAVSPITPPPDRTELTEENIPGFRVRSLVSES